MSKRERLRQVLVAFRSAVRLRDDFGDSPLLGQTGHAGMAGMTRMVESRCGAVALGCTYLLPPLSFGGALVV
jgi:hypothetical protein